MRVRLPSGWHEITAAKFWTGAKWASMTRGLFYDGSAWKQIATFAPPMSVEANGVFGIIFTASSGTVTAGPSTANPTGGIGPYTYVWEFISVDGGDTPTIVSPTMASTSFRQANVGAGELNNAGFRVTVTDSLGSTATDTITATFNNAGSLA